mmetsp:Transcript_9640/g.22013  ORF Transcript_9640/g.22013 Transcript_9640/m.22013 type:complete len:91 (-) Transcript_9640:44-316(-)
MDKPSELDMRWAAQTSRIDIKMIDRIDASDGSIPQLVYGQTNRAGYALGGSNVRTIDRINASDGLVPQLVYGQTERAGHALGGSNITDRY